MQTASATVRLSADLYDRMLDELTYVQLADDRIDVIRDGHSFVVRCLDPEAAAAVRSFARAA